MAKLGVAGGAPLQNLTQISRLCLPGSFEPKTAGAGLLRLLVRRGRAGLAARMRMWEKSQGGKFRVILGEAPWLAGV